MCESKVSKRVWKHDIFCQQLSAFAKHERTDFRPQLAIFTERNRIAQKPQFTRCEL